jgi:hypothetical protein
MFHFRRDREIGMALVIPKGPFGDPQLLMAVSDNTNEGTTWYFGSHSD